MILILCNEAFSDMEPDEETQKFYNEWSDTNYKEELQQQTDMMKMEFAEQARSMFDIEIEPDDIDDTPEAFARLAERLQEHIEDKGKKKAGHFSKRKKTIKQLEQEKLQKREEELTQRSMRSLFLSLAKALHPDTVTDAEEKARKEELMKKVTAAYAEKDLATLLKLEMEWINSETRALGTLPEDQLRLYLSSLKEQVEALEQELYALHIHPRFAEIADFARHPAPHALRQIREMANDYARVTGGLEEIMEIFSRPSPKQEILEFANEYIAVINNINHFAEDFLSEIY